MAQDLMALVTAHRHRRRTSVTAVARSAGSSPAWGRGHSNPRRDYPYQRLHHRVGTPLIDRGGGGAARALVRTVMADLDG
jgi:hypothetical protein